MTEFESVAIVTQKLNQTKTKWYSLVDSDESKKLPYDVFKDIICERLVIDIDETAIQTLYHRTSLTEKGVMMLCSYINYVIPIQIETITSNFIRFLPLPNNKFYSMLWSMNLEYKFYYKNK